MMSRLPKDVSKKYKLVNWKGGHRQWFGHRFGWVDIKRMTLQHADRLHSLGFSKLELRPAKEVVEEEEPSTEPQATITDTKAMPQTDDCGCGKKKKK